MYCLADGDKVEEAGICFDVLHTPGHTPGSVWVILHEKPLFCGDTLFYQGYGRVDLAGGSETAMMTSLARLMKLPDDAVWYPGHGMKTKIAWERGTGVTIAVETQLSAFQNDIGDASSACFKEKAHG